MTDLPDKLNVWFSGKLAGVLERDSAGRMAFRYDDSWMESGSVALSLSMPLRHEEFDPSDGVAHRFFANLLPEGEARRRIVRELKIPDDDFELLRAIGGECAGALSILEVDEHPTSDREWRELTKEELTALVSSSGRLWSEEQVNDCSSLRLSLAGAQDKCAVIIREGVVHMPKGDTPSTHILKFESPHFKHVAAYEVMAMWLARAAGLPVVDIDFKSVDRVRYVEIRRYDRVVEKSGMVQRLHQEDFCQALGLSHQKKYQEYGGPSFADCFSVVRNHSAEPALDVPNLLRWQIFNVLAGNSDGHAKNISLLYNADGAVRLAPFYDLVCTRAVEGIDHRLALFVGAESDPGMVLGERWKDMAKACDIRSDYLLGMVREMAETLVELWPSTLDAFQEAHGDYPALQRMEKVIVKQCHRALISQQG